MRRSRILWPQVDPAPDSLPLPSSGRRVRRQLCGPLVDGSTAPRTRLSAPPSRVLLRSLAERRRHHSTPSARSTDRAPDRPPARLRNRRPVTRRMPSGLAVLEAAQQRCSAALGYALLGGQEWPTSARSAPNLGRSRPFFHDIGQLWADFDQVWGQQRPDAANSGACIDCGRCWQMCYGVRRTSDRALRKFSELGPTWIEFAPNSIGFGPASAWDTIRWNLPRSMPPEKRNNIFLQCSLRSGAQPFRDVVHRLPRDAVEVSPASSLSSQCPRSGRRCARNSSRDLWFQARTASVKETPARWPIPAQVRQS